MVDLNKKVREAYNQATWRKALKEIYERSMYDKEFRALALSDARAALEKVVGMPPPEDIEVRFVEGSKPRDPVVLILPEMTDKIEISEEDLENVVLSFGKPDFNSPDAPAYHNWGSEKSAYHNWGSERVAEYHNWGSE